MVTLSGLHSSGFTGKPVEVKLVWLNLFLYPFFSGVFISSAGTHIGYLAKVGILLAKFSFELVMTTVVVNLEKLRYGAPPVLFH